MPQIPDPYAPTHPVPGKPVVKSFPTPNAADRIYVVRKDSRAAGYAVPDKGAPYDGPEAQKLKDFLFATAVPSDQTGWVDWYYVNDRLNQEAYNYVIEYPYADVDYPRVTRTYVLLRSDVVEPTADDVDPIFNGKEPDVDVPYPVPDYPLLLVDHKLTRLDDPILDNLFVQVTRTYERLPSPVITSYSQNEAKQIVTIETQDVETDALPVSSATTEVLKVDRTTTAKATVTTGTVPDVFPAALHEAVREDLTPPIFKAQIPTLTEEYNEAGVAVDPTLGLGQFKSSQQQVNEFVRRISITSRAPVTLPKSFFDQGIGHLSEGRFGEGFSNVFTNVMTLDNGMQAIDGGLLILEADVKPIGDGTSIKTVKSVASWPILRERTVDEHTGIALDITKQVVPVLDPYFQPKPAGYSDVMPYDKWRSIQITTKVDLSTLPGPQTFGVLHNIELPDVLQSVRAEWMDNEHYSSASEDAIQNPIYDPALNALPQFRSQRWLSVNNHSTVVAQSTISGVIIVKTLNGYRGPARARLVRSYFSGPPGFAPAPLLIRPVTGFAYLRGTHETQSGSDGYNTQSSEFSSMNTFEKVLIGPCLVGSYDLQNTTFNSGPVEVDASSAGFDPNATPSPDAEPQDDFTQISRVAAGGGILTVDINPSTPSSLNSGQEIVVSANAEIWRFGIVVQEVIYATIP